MSSEDGVIDLTGEVPPYKRQRLEAGSRARLSRTLRQLLVCIRHFVISSKPRSKDFHCCTMAQAHLSPWLPAVQQDLQNLKGQVLTGVILWGQPLATPRLAKRLSTSPCLPPNMTADCLSLEQYVCTAR